MGHGIIGSPTYWLSTWYSFSCLFSCDFMSQPGCLFTLLGAKGDPYINLFATISGKGDNPRNSLECETPLGMPVTQMKGHISFIQDYVVGKATTETPWSKFRQGLGKATMGISEH